MIDPLKMIKGYMSAVGFISVTAWIGLWAMPHTFWFEYEIVKPVKPTGIGLPLRFQSTRHVYRRSDLSGVDVLHCDLRDGEGFGPYSEKPWQGQISNPSSGASKPWRYAGKIPDIPSDCYLKSTIYLDLRYGIVKDQEPPVSETFPIE